MPGIDWNDALEKSLSVIQECDGFRHLVRMFDDNWYHVSRSGLQSAFKREFNVHTWEDLVALAEEKSTIPSQPETEELDAVVAHPRITHCDATDIKIAYFGDIHAPYHDQLAIDLTAKIIEKFAPDQVICGGDLVDFYAVSRFDRDPKRVLQLQNELDTGFAISKQLTAAAPKAKWFYLDANHEQRWIAYLHKNQEISGLRALDIHSLMRMDELGWQYGGTERRYTPNANLVFIHGTRYNKYAGYAVKAELTDRLFQQSVVQGHNHKIASYSARGPLSKVEGYEVGCLCALDGMDYTVNPNWNQGLMLITISDAVPTFNNVIFQSGNNRTWAHVLGGILTA